MGGGVLSQLSLSETQEYTVHNPFTHTQRPFEVSNQAHKRKTQVPTKAQNQLTFLYSNMQKYKLIKVGSNTNWREVKGKTGPATKLTEISGQHRACTILQHNSDIWTLHWP